MEISRFPGERLLRMPGSATTRGRLTATRDGRGNQGDSRTHRRRAWQDRVGREQINAPIGTNTAGVILFYGLSQREGMWPKVKSKCL
jgi:hypothetical protein